MQVAATTESASWRKEPLHLKSTPLPSHSRTPSHTHEPREADDQRGTDRQEPTAATTGARSQRERRREGEGKNSLTHSTLRPRRNNRFSWVYSDSKTASQRQSSRRGTVRDADVSANLRLGRNRPSTGRGPGSDPGPPCAFETSMIKVSCNSH